MTKLDFDKFKDINKEHEIIEEYNRFYCKKCNCYSKFKQEENEIE